MIIKHNAAWISTDEAVEWLRVRFGDTEMLMQRIDPLGIQVTITGQHGIPELFGMNSPDLVKFGRFILAVAAAQGQNINPDLMGNAGL